MSTTMYDLATMKDALRAVVDEQDGEITPEQEAAWDAVEGAFEYKVERTVLWIRDLRGDVAKADAELEYVKKQRDAAQRAVDRAEAFLDGRMRAFGSEKVKTPLASAWYATSTRVEPLVPIDADTFRHLADAAPSLIRVVPASYALDKEAIKSAAKAGTLPDEIARRVQIHVGKSLRIR